MMDEEKTVNEEKKTNEDKVLSEEELDDVAGGRWPPYENRDKAYPFF